MMLRMSPNELRADLPDARIARTGHPAEVAAVDITTRVVELGVVENVKELSANLEPHRLPDVGPF